MKNEKERFGLVQIGEQIVILDNAGKIRVGDNYLMIDRLDFMICQDQEEADRCNTHPLIKDNCKKVIASWLKFKENPVALISQSKKEIYEMYQNAEIEKLAVEFMCEIVKISKSNVAYSNEFIKDCVNICIGFYKTNPTVYTKEQMKNAILYTSGVSWGKTKNDEIIKHVLHFIDKPKIQNSFVELEMDEKCGVCEECGAYQLLSYATCNYNRICHGHIVKTPKISDGNRIKIINFY